MYSDTKCYNSSYVVYYFKVKFISFRLLKVGDLDNASLVLNAIEAKLPYMLQ